MTGILKGSCTGPNRADMLRHAGEQASKFFGTECVHARLYNQETAGDNFNADWQARVEHTMSKPSVGFAQCNKCGKSEATNPGMHTPTEWEKQ